MLQSELPKIESSFFKKTIHSPNWLEVLLAEILGKPEKYIVKFKPKNQQI